MFYTYILRSTKDGKRYIGYSSNLKLRLESHNKGLTPSTRNRRPFKLLCCKIFDTRIEAMRYERYLKKLKGGKRLNFEIEKMLEACPIRADVAQLVEQLHGKE